MTKSLRHFLRHLRIEADERLLDMADRLGVTVSYLSAVEGGRKKPSPQFENKIADEYNITGRKLRKFQNLCDRGRNSFVIQSEVERERELIGLFARKIGDLDESKLRKLKKVLGNDFAD